MKTLLQIVICIFIYQSSFSKAPKDDKRNRNFLTFCEEDAPVNDELVLKQYQFILKKTERTSLTSLRKKADVHFKVIEPILKRYNIPNDFKFIPIVESRFIATITSSKGARGFWQFMPQTAREMGLVINKFKDERTDLVKSTNAACRYFLKLYEELGSWTLVAAAYNAGPYRINQYMDNAESMSYYDFKMKSETAEYIYKVLAIKELFNRNLSEKETKTQEPVHTNLTSNYGRVRISSPKIVEETIVPKKDVILEPVPKTISTSVEDGSSFQKGQFWVFKVKKGNTFSNQLIEEGDKIYAIVEDFDSKTNRLFLHTIRIYSPKRNEIFQIPLTVVDDFKLGVEMPLDKTKPILWKQI